MMRTINPLYELLWNAYQRISAAIENETLRVSVRRMGTVDFIRLELGDTVVFRPLVPFDLERFKFLRGRFKFA